jgi:hypothetical protein
MTGCDVVPDNGWLSTAATNILEHEGDMYNFSSLFLLLRFTKYFSLPCLKDCAETSQHTSMVALTILNYFVGWASIRISFRIHTDMMNGYESRGSAVAIAPGYGIGVQISVGTRILTSPYRPDGSGAHPTSYPVGTESSLFWVKAVGACSWPLASNCCRGQENLHFYTHFPIRIHGIVLSELSTGATLYFNEWIWRPFC